MNVARMARTRALARGSAIRGGAWARRPDLDGATARAVAPSRLRFGCGERSSSKEMTMREIGHFIGGKAVKGCSGRFGDVFNPNTGEVQAKVALADKSDVDKAVANA